MKRSNLMVGLGACMAAPLLTNCAADDAKQPNVIVILADDMGMGDVSAYGSQAIQTPNIDRLANEGVRFNNGYATSATSTPSRYALMTGQYPWKNENAKILSGDAPLLISTEQFTLPKMMRSQGYNTAAIGKWHLGMGNGDVDWNTQITPCANDIGFDFSCLIAATNDRVPSVFVENGRVLGLDPADPLYVSYVENFEGEPTAISNPELMKMEWAHGHNQSVHNGIPRIGYQTGGESAKWVDEDMADFFMAKVKNFISGSKDEPFFLYYGLHQPHVPRTPNARFVGATEFGPRGDAVIEADWCVGELMSFLEEEGLLENTLVIFSSDNGPVLNDGYKDMAADLFKNREQLGGLRGGKYSLFDGGTHIPFFVYWKGHIEPKVSDAMVCQMDIMPSVAELLNFDDLPAMDGEAMLPTFMGTSDEGRDNLVLEANTKMAYRSGDWAMIPPYSGPEINETLNELGNSQQTTLWNLADDAAQTTDVAAENPELVERLYNEFIELTAGYYNPNAAEIKLE